MTPRGRESRRAGFTLVEVMIALLFLTVVAVTLGGALERSIRIVDRSREEFHAALFLEAEAERLRIVSYDSLTGGVRTRGRGIATWTVSDSVRFRTILLETRYGSPARGLVVDSVTLVRYPR